MNKIVIVGGVAGGATAAARLRRLDESAQIVVFERSGYVSYANCGLPYYIGGVITDREELTLQTPESFRARFNVDVRVEQEVIAVDRENRSVRVRRLKDGFEYDESYDSLILSTGAAAVRPEQTGGDDPRVFTLRTLEDTFRIREYMDAARVKRAVIIGGGFIGLEMAENLVHAGVKTTLLQRSAQVMPTLDADMAAILHTYLREKGVDLRFFTAVEGFEDADGRLRVLLRGEPPIDCDMVISAIGVKPDTELARCAGLELGARGAVAVDENMRTSDPDIFAVGDAVEVTHFVSGVKTVIPLAGPANKQGRIAADNICGIPSVYRGSQGSSIAKLFDMTAASTGLNEKTAKAAGVAYDRTVTFSASHAGYYPGSENMTVKLLFSPDDGRVLGAQIIGFSGVDKRIDVLATAIRAGMTVYDLTELELAYAPPFSSAKDPVNMAGFAAENVLRGVVKQYHWDEVDALAADPAVTLLDVRSAGEFRQGHFEGAVNIPLPQLRSRLGELDASKPLYVNCYSGVRSYIACRILTGSGFDCHNFSGGWRFYAQVTGGSAGVCRGGATCGESRRS